MSRNHLIANVEDIATRINLEDLFLRVSALEDAKLKIVLAPTAIRALRVAASNPLNTWTDLDLSSYVTEKTKFIILDLHFRDVVANAKLKVRKNGTNSEGDSNVWAQGTSSWSINSVIVPCDDSQIIEWLCSVANATEIIIAVAGYIEQG